MYALSGEDTSCQVNSRVFFAELDSLNTMVNKISIREQNIMIEMNMIRASKRRMLPKKNFGDIIQMSF